MEEKQAPKIQETLKQPSQRSFNLGKGFGLQFWRDKRRAEKAGGQEEGKQQEPEKRGGKNKFFQLKFLFDKENSGMFLPYSLESNPFEKNSPEYETARGRIKGRIRKLDPDFEHFAKMNWGNINLIAKQQRIVQGIGSFLKLGLAMVEKDEKIYYVTMRRVKKHGEIMEKPLEKREKMYKNEEYPEEAPFNVSNTVEQFVRNTIRIRQSELLEIEHVTRDILRKIVETQQTLIEEGKALNAEEVQGLAQALAQLSLEISDKEDVTKNLTREKIDSARKMVRKRNFPAAAMALWGAENRLTEGRIKQVEGIIGRSEKRLMLLESHLKEELKKDSENKTAYNGLAEIRAFRLWEKLFYLKLDFEVCYSEDRRKEVEQMKTAAYSILADMDKLRKADISKEKKMQKAKNLVNGMKKNRMFFDIMRKEPKDGAKSARKYGDLTIIEEAAGDFDEMGRIKPASLRKIERVIIANYWIWALDTVFNNEIKYSESNSYSIPEYLKKLDRNFADEDEKLQEELGPNEFLLLKFDRMLRARQGLRGVYRIAHKESVAQLKERYIQQKISKDEFKKKLADARGIYRLNKISIQERDEIAAEERNAELRVIRAKLDALIGEVYYFRPEEGLKN